MTASRPAGSLRLLASDALYPAGPDPWAGQPTKVRPGDSIVAAGHVPNTPPNPQHANFSEWEIRRYLEFLDTSEVQNWSAPYEVDLSGGGLNGLAGLAWRGWDAIGGPNPYVLVGNSSGQIWTSTDGITWTVEASTLGGETLVAATHRSASCAVLGTAVGSKSVYGYGTGSAGIWTRLVLAGADTVTCLASSDARQEIYVGGRQTTLTQPRVWVIDDSDPGDIDTATVTTLTRGGVSETITMIARSPNHGLAIGTLHAHVWGNLSGALTASAPSGGLPGGYEYRWVVWDAESGVFVIGGDETGGGAKIWTVADPFSAWVEVADLPDVQFTPRCAAIRGSTIVAGVYHAPRLLISSDAGVTWTSCVDPTRRITTAPVGTILRVVLAGNRLLAGRYRGTGIFQLTESIRLGR
jgi:hypothetical protein